MDRLTDPLKNLYEAPFRPLDELKIVRVAFLFEKAEEKVGEKEEETLPCRCRLSS